MNIAATQYSLSTKSFEIYVAGCNKNPKCRGCHNSELFCFNVGRKYDKSYYLEIYNKLHMFQNLIESISILGGEPLDQDRNDFLKLVKDMSTFDFELWLYTRYYLNEIPKDLFSHFDYIKCGEYDDTKLVDNNIQYGIKLASSNQVIYKRGLDY